MFQCVMLSVQYLYLIFTYVLCFGALVKDIEFNLMLHFFVYVFSFNLWRLQIHQIRWYYPPKPHAHLSLAFSIVFKWNNFCLPSSLLYATYILTISSQSHFYFIDSIFKFQISTDFFSFCSYFCVEDACFQSLSFLLYHWA